MRIPTLPLWADGTHSLLVDDLRLDRDIMLELISRSSNLLEEFEKRGIALTPSPAIPSANEQSMRRSFSAIMDQLALNASWLQSASETSCPSLFTVVARGRRKRSLWMRKTGELELQLMCEHPGGYHPASEGGKYIIPTDIGMDFYTVSVLGPLASAVLGQSSENEVQPIRAEGAMHRALDHLLREKDPQCHWGGLRKVMTARGKWLWVCDMHASQF